MAAPAERGARAVKRFERAAIAAVLVAAVVLAVLGYVSLRQWLVSAELLFREQARDMAAMAAQKVEMSVLKAEEECLRSLQVLLLDSDFRPDMVDAWKTGAPLVGQVSLVDAEGRPLHVSPASRRGDPALAGLLAEIPRSFWERGGRRHLMVGDEVVLAAVLRSTRGPLLVVLRRNEEALRRDVLTAALAGAEGPSVLALIDRADRPVYSPRPLDQAERILTVPFGEALPTWRVALYQPAGLSPRDAVGRQAMLFTAAFACLLGGQPGLSTSRERSAYTIMARILIVDDEPEMVRGLEDNLRFEGYHTVSARRDPPRHHDSGHERLGGVPRAQEAWRGRPGHHADRAG
jgi:hypothetical protein